MLNIAWRACAVALLAAGTPVLAEGGTPADKPLLDRAAVIAAAVNVTAEAYPNADDVVVDDYTQVRVNPDGTAVQLSDSYQKILTEKGRRDNQTVQMGFTIPYDRVVMLALEVIKADGTIVPVDIESQSRVMIDPSQMSHNIYNPDDKVLQVGVPGLEIGDVLHTFCKTELVKTVVPNTWSDLQMFEYTSPIKHHVYEVHAPKELPLRRIALKNPIPGTVTASQQESDSGVVHRWEVKDVPRMYAEPDMPPLHTVVQRLLVSTVEEWEDISRWYWNVSEPHLETVTPEMREKVAEITKGLTDPEHKTEAVFRWVAQEVRYLGITVEKDAPGFEPHDVSSTFEQRHGVCRDKAALLVAMLRLAGLDAYPVMIYVGPKKDEEVPQPAFNHAIVAVERKDGSTALMDPTDESSKDIFPAYLSNRSYLVAKPGGAPLRTSPIIPAEKNMMRVKTRAQIGASGRIEGESELVFEGINDSTYRGYFARLSPEERERFFEGALKTAAAGAELLSFEMRPADLLNTNEELTVKMRFQADDVLIHDGETALFGMPALGSRIGMANFVLGKAGLVERKYPLVTEFACGSDEEITLELDPALGRPISLPSYETIDDEGIKWQGRVEHSGGVIHSRTGFAVKVVEFSPEQYGTLKRNLRTMEFDGRKMPIVQRELKGDPNADVLLLDRRVKISINDADNWSEEHYVKKKVLTYKGKKDQAEVKLSFNSGWEDIKVLEARVLNGSGAREVSPTEMNLMDASWVASAPRYPAGKTLVVSFPGVETGSIIEYRLLIEKKDRPFFSTLQVFRDFNPVELKQVTIDAPANLNLNVFSDGNGVAVPNVAPSAEAGLFASHEARRGGRVVRDWTVRAQTALSKEDQTPPIFGIAPVLHVSSGSWQAYAAQLREVLLAAAENQPAAEAAARKLAAGMGKRRSLEAIRDFVAQTVRSAGPALDQLPLSAVTAADTTLREGYGNTTDRAVLLYAMLRALDLQPEFLLISSEATAPDLKDFRAKHADIETFDQVLVRVQLDGGQVLLNDTDQYARLGTTRAEGRLALDLDPAEIESVKVEGDLQDATEFDYRVAVQADGSAVVRVLRKDYGAAFEAAHKHIAEMPPEQRKRYHQELVAGISQSAHADGPLITDYEAYPGIESYTVKVDRLAVADGGYLYLELPYSLAGFVNVRDDARKNPLLRDGYTRFAVNTVVELPAEYARAVLLPKSGEWTLPDGGGAISAEVTAEELPGDKGIARLNIKHRISLKPAVILSADYGQLLRINRELAHPGARTILLTKPAAAGRAD